MSYENYCPYCGKPKYDEVEDRNEYVSKQPKALDREKEWARVKSLVARKKLEQASELCEVLIADDPAGLEGYLGFARIATENYTLFEEKDIDETIRVFSELFADQEEVIQEFEPAYLKYIETRKKYFSDKKAKEEARKAKELEKAKEESPFEIIEDMLVKYNGDAPYVIIPDGVKKIGANAFSGNENLYEVVIPEGVTAIRRMAFYNCKNLANVELPSTLETIEYQSFGGCASLVNIDLPEGLVSIGNLAFYDCSALANIDLPEGFVSIGNQAFYSCTALTRVCLPASLGEMGIQVFYNCSSLNNRVEYKSTKENFRKIRKASNWNNNYVRYVFCTDERDDYNL